MKRCNLVYRYTWSGGPEQCLYRRLMQWALSWLHCHTPCRLARVVTRNVLVRWVNLKTVTQSPLLFRDNEMLYVFSHEVKLTLDNGDPSQGLSNLYSVLIAQVWKLYESRAIVIKFEVVRLLVCVYCAEHRTPREVWRHRNLDALSLLLNPFLD